MSRHTKMNKFVKDEMEMMDIDDEDDDAYIEDYNDGTIMLIQMNGS